MSTTTAERGRVIADLLRSAIQRGLPLPSVRDGKDTIRFTFESVADLRAWAEFFKIATHTLQEVEHPETVIEFFDGEVAGVPVRGLAQGRRLVVAS